MQTAKCNLIIIAIAISFLGIMSILTLWVENRSIYINELFYASPYVRWLYVFIGMQIAAIVKKAQIHFATAFMSLAEVVCVFCAVGWFACRNIISAPLVILRLVDIVLCASFVFVFSIGRGAISHVLQNDSFSFAGKLSSYVFVVHFVVIFYVDLWFEKNRLLFGQWTGVVELFIIVVIIFVVIRHICLLKR